MVHILIPEKFNLALFCKAFFPITGISPISTKKVYLGSVSDGLQKGTKSSLVLLCKREK